MCVCEYEMRLKEILLRAVVVVVLLIVHLLPSPELARGQCTLAEPKSTQTKDSIDF